MNSRITHWEGAKYFKSLRLAPLTADPDASVNSWLMTLFKVTE